MTAATQDTVIYVNANNAPLSITIVVILSIWFVLYLFKGALKTYFLKKHTEELIEANAV